MTTSTIIDGFIDSKDTKLTTTLPQHCTILSTLQTATHNHKQLINKAITSKHAACTV